jgi:hypothetical protein
MITPKQDVGSLQMDKLAEEMQDVSRPGGRHRNIAFNNVNLWLDR